MAAQTLLLPSVAAQIPISKPKTLTLTLTFPSLSFKLSPSSLSNCGSRSFVSSSKARSFVPGFVRSAVLSSEVEEESGGEQPSFSPDLKLFVGNLPFTVDSSELADLFERAGTVEMVEVIYDKLTGRSRGFGFVTMSTINEVEAAVQQFNGYELSGRSLRVNAGPPPPRDGPLSRGPRVGSSTDSSNRVYVGNLPWGADNLSLETLFGEHGKVMEAKVVYERESGRSRGFGFVTFSSADEADNAISSLDGIDFDGRTIRVTIAEEKPRRQF